MNVSRVTDLYVSLSYLNTNMKCILSISSLRRGPVKASRVGGLWENSTFGAMNSVVVKAGFSFGNPLFWENTV